MEILFLCGSEKRRGEFDEGGCFEESTRCHYGFLGKYTRRSFILIIPLRGFTSLIFPILPQFQVYRKHLVRKLISRAVEFRKEWVLADGLS